MSVTEPIQIPIEGDATDFIADAKKVQEQMDILAHRLDKAGVSQAAYNKAVANSKSAVTGQVDAVKKSTMSITDLRSAYMMVADAARIAGQVWNATGQEFVNYAEEVKNMSRSLGASAEETSRLIQISDDVRISYDALKMGFKNAQKDGIEPNIESLARLSDTYLSLPAGVERTQFAIDKFGSKAGPELEKLLIKGGNGIRSMSNAIDENLIMTEKGIQKSDAYQVSLDNLTDTKLGLSMAFGEATIEPVTNLFDNLTDSISVWTSNAKQAEIAWDNFSKTNPKVASGLEKIKELYLKINPLAILYNTYFGKNTTTVEENTVAQDKNSAAQDEAAVAAAAAASAIDAQKEAVQGAKDALKDYQDALDAVSQSNQDMESMSRTIAEDQVSYSESHNEATQNKIDKEREYAEAVKEYGRNSEEALTKLGDVDIAQEGIDKLQASWHEAANNMIYDMILVGVSAGGLLDSEQKAIDEYAVKTGIKTQADIDEANRRREVADATIEGILQSENVLTEQRKVDAETLRLQDAVTSASSITASNNEAAAIAQVSLYTQRETDNQALLAAKAKITASAYATIKYPSTSTGTPYKAPTGTTGGKSPDEREHATGGDFLIPMAYGNEGFRMGNGDTASGGERVTITPKGQAAAGGAVYNIIVNNPKKETAEASIIAAMKKIAYTGAAA